MDEYYAEYCQQYSNDPVALDALKKFLGDRPVYQPTIELLPVDEYEMRLDIVARIETQARAHDPSFRVNAAIFSLFMVMPLQQLQGLGSIDGMDVESLGFVPQLIQSFTRGPKKANTQLSKLTLSEAFSGEAAKLKKRSSLGNELDLATGTGHKRFRSEGSGIIGSGSGSGSQANASSSDTQRNRSESSKCRQRDGYQCIITKTDCPQVCHVVPFSWCGSDRGEVMSRLFHGKTDQFLLGGDRINIGIRADFISGNLDKSWNMICLSASLHTWWGKAYFGLKYLGSMPFQSDNAQIKVIVTLEFRWLKQNKHSKATDTLNQQQQHGFQAKLFEAPQPAVAANVCPSNRPILSGQTFDVTLDEIDAPKFITVIKIQWALVQLAAMSGGAEPIDESRHDQMDQLLAQQEVPVSVAEWVSQVPAGQVPPGENDDKDTTNPSSRALGEILPPPANPSPRSSPRASRPGDKSPTKVVQVQRPLGENDGKDTTNPSPRALGEIFPPPANPPPRSSPRASRSGDKSPTRVVQVQRPLGIKTNTKNENQRPGP